MTDSIAEVSASRIALEVLKLGRVEALLPYRTNLLTYASKFGRPVASRRSGSLVDELVPKSQEEARRNSMSAQRGLGRFPFHTDAAYFRVPPRFVFLRLAEGASSTSNTLLLGTRELAFSEPELADLRREIWVIRPGRCPFYAPVVGYSSASKSLFFRYDPCCMTPTLPRSSKTEAALQKAFMVAKPSAVAWAPEKIVIIENWTTLHAREAVRAGDCGRRVLTVRAKKSFVYGIDRAMSSQHFLNRPVGTL
jgi:hypothetical protein